MYPYGTGRTGRILQTRPTLSSERVLGVFFAEHIDRVGGHLLLRNQDLLGAIDDEVTTRVQWTFIQLC